MYIHVYVDVEVDVYIDVGILAVWKGPQSQFRYCWWYRSSPGTDFRCFWNSGPCQSPHKDKDPILV